jgi:prepilin-type N-terminal cleavage/methylation domain-containing protein
MTTEALSPRRPSGSGFTLIEVLVATALLLIVMAAVFRATSPLQRGFSVEPETADLQQRLRVAVDALSNELLMAGAGSDRGRRAGSLNYFFAPVVPYRRGLRNPDQPGTYRGDTITIVYATGGAAQATISLAMTAQSGDATLGLEAGCPVNDLLCGFKAGMNVLIFDDTGSFDAFTVTGVQGSLLHLQHNFRDDPRSYPPGSTIVEASIRTYYLKADAATDMYQLMQYDGGRGADVPVVDHLVGLAFDYFGEAQPPQMRRTLDDPIGPWTTYGPTPPAADVSATAYPAGENCVFALGALPNPVPRLGSLTAGSPSLVHLTPAQLTDGPWCPDATSPNRYDADLLRIRKISVTVRVEAAVAALRGPAGRLFSRGGTSDGGARMVPDQEVRLQISPRNLNLGR